MDLEDFDLDIDPNSRKPKRSALGKGLSALLPEENMEEGSPDFFQCDIEMITPNPHQPRIRFSNEELEELAQSIREQGIIQPLIVRASDNGYELAAGERRLRAAKLARLTQVPVIVKELTDKNMLEMSIVENIQRENLNPIEEADSYYRLMTEFQLTQDQLAERVGKSRPAVANFLRLRNLPPQIKETILDGVISMGHARALLGAETSADQMAAWRQVIDKNLSVRETERLIKRMKAEREKPENDAPDPDEAYFANLSEELSRFFGTRVKINRKGKKGKVEIEFYGDEDLDRLIERLKQAGAIEDE